MKRSAVRDRNTQDDDAEAIVFWSIERLGPDGWREALCGGPDHMLRSFRQWSTARKTRFRVLDEHGEIVAGPSDLGGFRDDRQFLAAVAVLWRQAGLRDSMIGADRVIPRVVAAMVSALQSRKGGPSLGEMYAIEEPEIRRALFALLAAVEESPAAIDAWIRRHA